MVKLKYYQWMEYVEKAKKKNAKTFFINDEEFEVKKVELFIQDFSVENIYETGFEMIPLRNFRDGI